jgi:hypothetical protein
LTVYDLSTPPSVVAHWLHNDPFFIGYTSFAVDDQDGTLIGTSPVGNLDGSFSWGTLDLQSRAYTNQSLLKFKAMMDDSLLYESATDTAFVQADYDLRSNGPCPGGQELCLLNIEASTGKVRDVKTTPYTVYKYAHGANSTSAVAFLEDSSGRCTNSTSSQVS